MHEIVTIQVGRQANYVGTHFWNAQQSYHTFDSEETSPINADIHFRQGVGPDGSDTYLPRTLIYDLKGGFGSMARVNVLGADIDDQNGDSAWDGATARLQHSPPEPSPYLKSLITNQQPVLPTAATTQYFSDFASSFYHPRSLIPVTPAHPVLDPSSQAATNDLPSFNTFADGSSLFETIDATEDVFDRDIRPWVEECDSMQGIQLITSSDDAWGGFTSAYVEEIRDQLGKASIWVWGLDRLEQREQTMGTRRLKALNHALTLASLGSHASAYLPVSLPTILDSSVQLDKHVLWHTSALANAVLETITLPIRQRAVGGSRVPTLSDWEDAINDNGRRKVFDIALEAGSPSTPSTGMFNGHTASTNATTDTRMHDSGQLLEDEEAEREAANASLPINLLSSPSSLLPSASLRPRTFARIDTYRGSHWSIPPSAQQYQDQDLRFLRRGRPVLETYIAIAPLLPLLPTFPHIFTAAPAPSSNLNVPVPGLEMRASLRTSSAVATWIRGMEATVRAMPAGLWNEVGGKVEREGVRNELGVMAEMYVEGWESGGDDSGDEI